MMKRIVIGFAMALALGGPAFAQDDTSQQKPAPPAEDDGPGVGGGYKPGSSASSDGPGNGGGYGEGTGNGGGYGEQSGQPSGSPASQPAPPASDN